MTSTIHIDQREASTRLDAVDARVAELTGHLNVLHAELVDLAVELVDLDGTWAAEGLHSPELYLAWKAGLAPGTARKVVAVARRVAEFPDTVDAFRRGELTLDQVATVVHPRVPGSADERLAELATKMTVGQLRRVVNNYQFTPPTPDAASDDAPAPDAAPETEPEDASTAATDPPADASADPDHGSGFDEGWMSFGFDDLHRFSLSLSGGDADTGRLIEAALLEARDRLFREADTSGGVAAEVTWVDALRDVCQRSLDFGGATSRSDRYRIHVHLDTDARGSDVLGWNLPDAITRYLTCDGLLVPTFVADGVPVSVGRTQRIIPERTRIVVLQRDGGCGVPGCRATHGLEIHHIIHWTRNGPTETWNLLTLCPRHHRLHHQGKLGITGNADLPGGVTFTDARGRPLRPSGSRPTPPTGPPPDPSVPYRHPLGERLDPRWIDLTPSRR